MKTKITLKLVLLLFFQFTLIAVNAQDTDGDGVIDTTETANGTNPNDACSYNVYDMTLPNTAYQDCDGDGAMDANEIVNGTNPFDPCDYLISDVTLINTAGIDCDGDGVIDWTEITNGTNPQDACDYNLADVTLANTAGIDCDGDGVLDVTEITNGTNHQDACDYAIYDITLPNTAGMDCDNDGVNDAVELASGTDPHDACSYLVADQSNTNTAGIDCDGDGVLDVTELASGTDPHNPCDYNVINITLSNTAGMDCDGDGVLDATELTNGTNPFDACSYNVADVTLANTAMQDCDGDGVLDVTEFLDFTDSHDACDFIMANQTVTPTTICNSNTITGNIKLDYNTNGCDAADFPLSNVLVTSADGSNVFSTFTDVNGNYIQNTNSGNFTTSASGFSSSYSATPNTQTTTFVGNGNTDNIDFCVAPASTVDDLNITIIPLNNPVPSNMVNYQIVYKNVGNTIANGSVSFNYDGSKLTFQNASITPATTTSTAVLFNYTNLNPYEIRTINLTFLVSTANIGDILVFSSQIDPITGDATAYDNNIAFAQIVSATLINRNVNSANETNDMIVLEGDEIDFPNVDEYLHYIIRFQNTGTNEAVNVIVTNELSDKLDWDTIQLEKQSHNGQVLIKNGNQITFNFANINLPSSATDEPNSHGYIAYRIKPKSNIVIGNFITNTANIYLGNDPVISTNTTNTLVDEIVSVNDNAFSELVSVYPNPVNDVLFIKTNNSQVIHVSVYSNLGQLVLNKTADTINQVNLETLSKGIYFIKLNDNEGNTAIKKVILE